MQLPCGEQNYGVVQQCNSRPSNSAANSCKQLFTALFLSYIKAICDATFGTYDEIMTQRSRIWELYTRNFIGLLKQYDLKKKRKQSAKKGRSCENPVSAKIYKTMRDKRIFKKAFQMNKVNGNNFMQNNSELSPKPLWMHLTQQHTVTQQHCQVGWREIRWTEASSECVCLDEGNVIQKCVISCWWQSEWRPSLTATGAKRKNWGTLTRAQVKPSYSKQHGNSSADYYVMPFTSWSRWKRCRRKTLPRCHISPSPSNCSGAEKRVNLAVVGQRRDENSAAPDRSITF